MLGFRVTNEGWDEELGYRVSEVVLGSEEMEVQSEIKNEEGPIRNKKKKGPARRHSSI